MLAFPTLFLTEMNTHSSGIHEFDKLSPSLQLGLVSIMFVSEFSSMIRGWTNPFDLSSTEKFFKLNFSFNRLKSFSC